MTSLGATEIIKNNATKGQQFNSNIQNQRPNLSQTGLTAVNTKRIT